MYGQQYSYKFISCKHQSGIYPITDLAHSLLPAFDSLRKPNKVGAPQAHNH